MDDEVARVLRESVFAHLAAVDERGRPHVSPVWVGVDPRGLVVVNTAEGRTKARLLTEGASVALSATYPDDPYNYIALRGTVVERTHEGAAEMIDALSHKYKGVPFSLPAGQQRVTVMIEPFWDYVHRRR